MTCCSSSFSGLNHEISHFSKALKVVFSCGLSNKIHVVDAWNYGQMDGNTGIDTGGFKHESMEGPIHYLSDYFPSHFFYLNPHFVSRF